MHIMKLPIVLLSAFALVAPAVSADAKDKGKNKNKDHKEQKADDRKGGHGSDHDRDRDGDRDRDRNDRDGKITICHIPPGNPSNRHTITVGESAWAAHSGHGDHRGACGRNNQGGGRFDAMDLNDDGVISVGEWTGDRATFDRLDRNNDGVISRAEYRR